MIEHNTLKINNTTFEYSIKAYEEPSEEFGLNGGKISKLTIKRDNERRFVQYKDGKLIPVTRTERVRTIYTKEEPNETC